MSERIPDGVKAWTSARRRHHLSHAHVQMARELGMNPRKLGGLDNHRQERWKAPLPTFIEDLYLQRFGRERPEVVLSIEEWFRQHERKKVAKRAAKLRRREALTEAAAVVRDKRVAPAAPAVESRATIDGVRTRQVGCPLRSIVKDDVEAVYELGKSALLARFRVVRLEGVLSLLSKLACRPGWKAPEMGLIHV